MKVKIGHQRVENDAIAVIDARNCASKFIWADGNRGWNQSDIVQFSQMLKKHDTSIDGYIEFIDVYLQRSILGMHRGL